jgi:hypothetical protein
MHLPNKDKRGQIVYRIHGGTSVVQASAITNVEELAYGMSFLAHHRLYKMSKDGVGVNLENAVAVAAAFKDAADAFYDDVIGKLDPQPMVEVPRLSDLGDGVVANPYGFVSKG